MKKEPRPYNCHVFVFTNNRHGERISCADGGNEALKDFLKEEIEKRGWKNRVRVSSSGCMGLCARGPNVILYPEGMCLCEVSSAEGEHILGEIVALLPDAGEKS